MAKEIAVLDELMAVIEAIRRDLRDHKLDRTDPVRLVDSAPVAWMTYSRGARCKSVVGSQFLGVVTSKKGKVFGLRLHTTVTVNQLIDEWLLTPASIPDPQVLDALVLDSRDLVLMGTRPSAATPNWKSACGASDGSSSCPCARTTKTASGRTGFKP